MLYSQNFLFWGRYVMNMYKYDVINVDGSGGKHGVARWTSKNTVVAK